MVFAYYWVLLREKTEKSRERCCSCFAIRA